MCIYSNVFEEQMKGIFKVMYLIRCSLHLCRWCTDRIVCCRYDYVEVEDISEISTIIWGRWCGQRAPSRITSRTNLIKITFKSDDYFVAKPGFQICYSMLVSFTAVCIMAGYFSKKLILLFSKDALN